MEHPFAKFRVGQLLNARVVAIPGHSGKGTKGHNWELSIKPSVMACIGTFHLVSLFLFVGTVCRPCRYFLPWISYQALIS